MRGPMSLPSRSMSSIAVALTVLTMASCSSGDAAPADVGPPAQSSSKVKMHVVIEGGPHKGTYDMTSEACLANALGPNSWNATYDAETPVKGTPSAVMVTSHPTSRVAEAKTMGAIFFGEDADKVIYEMKPAVVTVTDRGGSATIVARGKARTSFYADGSFGDGGEVVITVECDTVERH